MLWNIYWHKCCAMRNMGVTIQRQGVFTIICPDKEDLNPACPKHSLCKKTAKSKYYRDKPPVKMSHNWALQRKFLGTFLNPKFVCKSGVLDTLLFPEVHGLRYLWQFDRRHTLGLEGRAEQTGALFLCYLLLLLCQNLVTWWIVSQETLCSQNGNIHNLYSSPFSLAQHFPHNNHLSYSCVHVTVIQIFWQTLYYMYMQSGHIRSVKIVATSTGRYPKTLKIWRVQN